MLTHDQVVAIAGAVEEPVWNQPLSNYKAIKNVVIDGDSVALTVVPGYPVKSVAAEIESRVKKALLEAGAKTALITIGYFLGNDYQRSKLYDPTFTHEFREASQ